MKAYPQQRHNKGLMGNWIVVLLLSAFTVNSQVRTWTFAQDGVSVSDSGKWSFKKGGRVEGLFVRRDGTNAVLLVGGKERPFPIICFVEADRKFARFGKASDYDVARAKSASKMENATEIAKGESVRAQGRAETKAAMLSKAKDKEQRAAEESKEADILERDAGLYETGLGEAAMCRMIAQKKRELAVDLIEEAKRIRESVASIK